jgi:hypothetical protein
MPTLTEEKVTSAAVSERRAAPRLPGSVMPSITSVRLSPVARGASLVNISSSGALLRCPTKLLPGTPTTVMLDGTFSPSSIKGKVVRCLVADINRPAGLSYHIGVAFNEDIELQEEIDIHRPVPLTAGSIPAAVLFNRW